MHVKINIKEQNKVFKKIFNGIKNSDRNAFSKRISEALEVFSYINNENDLNNYMKKHKLSIDDLENGYLPIKESPPDGAIYVKFNMLSVLTNNSFMLNYFYNKGLIPLSSGNMETPLVFQSINNNENYVEIGRICKDVEIMDSFIYFNHTENNCYINTLKIALDDVKNNRMDKKNFVEYVVKFIEKTAFLPDELIESYQFIIDNNIRTKKLIDTLKSNLNIRSSYSHFTNIKALKLLCNIVDEDIYENKSVIKNLLLNPELFDEFLQKYSYGEINKKYADVQKEISDDNIERLGYNYALKSFSLTDHFQGKDTVYAGANIEILEVLHKHGLLKKMIKNHPNLLEKYFTNYDINIKGHEESFERVKDLLIKEYGFNYGFCYKDEKGIDVVRQLQLKYERSAILFENYISEKRFSIPDLVYEKIIEQVVNKVDKRFLDMLIDNPKSLGVNNVYLKIIEVYGKDKRIKSFSNEESVEVFAELLSEEYRKKHNITVSLDQIVTRLNNKPEKGSLGIFVEKMIINYHLQKECGSLISIPKKRL